MDASVAVKWLVEEEGTELAIAALQLWRSTGTRMVAPYFMLAEVTNALHRYVKKGKLTVDRALELLDQLMTLEIELHETSKIHHRALDLASRLNHGAAYDSHYLALAETLDCDLWTADQRLQRTAAPIPPAVRWLGELAS